MLRGLSEKLLKHKKLEPLAGQVQLIFTSPPFPLQRKKKYGNLQGAAYLGWLASFAPLFKKLLKPNGSLVVEVGNAWEPGQPVMSTLPLRALLALLEKGEFNLCQQFVSHNPARLPGPAQWVNIERIRVKDSFTHVWWMSPSKRPAASNKRVLVAYSEAMRKLLRTRKYNKGLRPSGHRIGAESFFTNNHGAIPSSVITASNTTSADAYHRHCREKSLGLHPARMPDALADFFISFLTKPGDLVLDPFGGSNTTGASAERLGRRWISIEPTNDYIRSSKGRFGDTELLSDARVKQLLVKRKVRKVAKRRKTAKNQARRQRSI
jgi:site-specific DNA-methyltransferase (cytosine-N4-specific)